jgi:hypothetical protein
MDHPAGGAALGFGTKSPRYVATLQSGIPYLLTELRASPDSAANGLESLSQTVTDLQEYLEVLDLRKFGLKHQHKGSKSITPGYLVLRDPDRFAQDRPRVSSTYLSVEEIATRVESTSEQEERVAELITALIRLGGSLGELSALSSTTSPQQLRHDRISTAWKETRDNLSVKTSSVENALHLVDPGFARNLALGREPASSFPDTRVSGIRKAALDHLEQNIDQLDSRRNSLMVQARVFCLRAGRGAIEGTSTSEGGKHQSTSSAWNRPIDLAGRYLSSAGHSSKTAGSSAFPSGGETPSVDHGTGGASPDTATAKSRIVVLETGMTVAAQSQPMSQVRMSIPASVQAVEQSKGEAMQTRPPEMAPIPGSDDTDKASDKNTASVLSDMEQQLAENSKLGLSLERDFPRLPSASASSQFTESKKKRQHKGRGQKNKNATSYVVVVTGLRARDSHLAVDEANELSSPLESSPEPARKYTASPESFEKYRVFNIDRPRGYTFEEEYLKGDDWEDDMDLATPLTGAFCPLLR